MCGAWSETTPVVQNRLAGGTHGDFFDTTCGGIRGSRRPPGPARRNIMNCKLIVPGSVFFGALTLFPNIAAAQYIQSNLVANRVGLGATNIDPNLINAWGLTPCQIERHEDDTESPNSVERADESSLFCVADAFAGVVTVYTRSGVKVPVTITLRPAKLTPFPVGLPTGIVFNTTHDFVISENGKSGPALLIFASLDGTISGWNPDVDATHSIIMVDNSTKTPFPASYNGLTMARDRCGRNILYAADSGGFSSSSSNNEIDMFDGKFRSLGNFTDLNGTSGMVVYNVQNVEGKLFVTFFSFTPLSGGVVDVFDTEGKLLTPAHFATNSPGGPLEAPWGVALAPDGFGSFSHTILIGNVDDGHISAFDPRSHQFLGQLTDTSGNVISVDGLWGLVFDRGGDEGSNRLFFAAGPNNYADGLFGKMVPADDQHQK